MLRVLTADNPSPLTGPGTNTFLLGRDRVAVIDPGPDDARHRAAILAAVGQGRVAAILVTHPHLDHSAGVPALAAATGAPVLAFGTAMDGRSPLVRGVEGVGGGEGLDHAFRPDRRLADGEVIADAEWSLQALWTPGHCGAHLCFRWGEALFSGDLILGWSSTIISPPDGDLGDYLRSLARLRALGLGRLLPAHGDPVEDPAARIDALLAHRRARTAEILAALHDGPADAATLARRIYAIPEALLPAATRNTLAHLLALHDLGALVCEGRPSAHAVFART